MATPSESPGLNASNTSSSKTVTTLFHQHALALDKDKTIYCVYGGLDGLANAYGIIKSVFDVRHYAESQIISLDEMHEWMQTPTGISLAIVSSTFFTVFAALGNLFSEKDAALYKQNIALSWKYCRELIQAERNAFKGWRIAILAVSLFSTLTLSQLIIPFTLVFGSIYTISRLLFLNLHAKRAKMIKENEKIYQSLFNQTQLSLSPSQIIREESFNVRNLCLLLRAFNGFMDSLYLYIGILSLAPLSPSLLIAAGIVSIIYCLVCIATRAYEEYDSQLKLLISGYKINAQLTANRLQEALDQLQALSEQLSSPNHDKNKVIELESQQAHTIHTIEPLLTLFQAEQSRLINAQKLSPLSAVLLGARRGIAAYGALLSVLFCLAVLSTFCLSITLSPGLVFGCILAGIPLLLGFIFDAYQHVEQQKQYAFNKIQSTSRIIDLVNGIKEGRAGKYLTTTDQYQTVRNTLLESLYLDPLPGTYWTDCMEMLRACCSAIIKGKKEIEFLFTGFQQADANGHYQDTALMKLMVAPVAAIYAVFFALRAFTKGFKEPLTHEKVPVNPQIHPPHPRDSRLMQVPIVTNTHSFFSKPSDNRTTQSNQKVEKHFFNEGLLSSNPPEPIIHIEAEPPLSLAL